MSVFVFIPLALAAIVAAVWGTALTAVGVLLALLVWMGVGLVIGAGAIVES